MVLVSTAFLVGAGGLAAAAPRTVTGVVTAAPARWTADGSRIITEATIHTPTGDVVVSQLGGSVDGLAQRTFPGPAALAVGMPVTVTVHDDVDLARRMHTVVDDVAPLPNDAAAGFERFVRSGPTKAGHYLRWASGCIFVTYDSAGTTALPGDTEFPLIDAAIATWNTDTASCSYMVVKSLGKTAAPAEVGNDGVNLIKFRDDTWCRPAVDDDPMRCYDASSAGLTTATYVDDTSARDGTIVDADIEINGVNFAISDGGMSLSTQTCDAELQNTMTHELGHLHGLEHTCVVPTDPPRVDNNGNAVPACADTTDPTILNATMYPFQTCGETKKEMLSPDDIAGICTIYPTASSPNTCEPASESSSGGGGCCEAGSPAAPAAMLAVVTLLCLVRRDPRRRGARTSRT